MQRLQEQLCRFLFQQEFHLELLNLLLFLPNLQQFHQQLINADSDTIYVPENILQHQGILEAALDRDEDLLRRLIHDHLSRNLAQPLPEKISR